MSLTSAELCYEMTLSSILLVQNWIRCPVRTSNETKVSAVSTVQAINGDNADWEYSCHRKVLIFQVRVPSTPLIQQ